jgi:hypothetical protein
LLTTGTINRMAAPGNANSLNCRAVSNNCLCTLQLI